MTELEDKVLKTILSLPKPLSDRRLALEVGIRVEDLEPIITKLLMSGKIRFDSRWRSCPPLKR